MALEIPVIFHDYTPIMPSFAHRTFDYGGIPVFVHDHNALMARISLSLENGHYLTPNQVSDSVMIVNNQIADGKFGIEFSDDRRNCCNNLAELEHIVS